uniref:Uncharacterized protein n=1 Tax=Oryzias latipes TaxID=8090 RepID=A0A3B3I9R8_ORYLA
MKEKRGTGERNKVSDGGKMRSRVQQREKKNLYSSNSNLWCNKKSYFPKNLYSKNQSKIISSLSLL